MDRGTHLRSTVYCWKKFAVITVCVNDIDVVVFFKRLYLTLTVQCMYNTIIWVFLQSRYSGSL